MAAQRNRIIDFGAYLAVRLAVCLIQSLTDRAARGWSKILGWLIWSADRRHRKVADENLQFAFPHWNVEQRKRLIWRCYRHFATVVVEMARMPRKLHVHNWRDTVRHLDVHTDPRLFLCDRPILVVTGHFGNWELMCYVFGLIGLRTHAIARPIDNPYLERFVRRFRERTGQKILAKKGDFDRMQELLAKGAILGIVGDQDAGPRGLFVDFFGRPASTHKAIALMALEFRAPLVVLGTPRVAEPASYHILVEDWIEPSEYDGRPDAVSAITQRFTSALERLVRRFPEQYFWLHRRWKHQPQPRRHKKAA